MSMIVESKLDGMCSICQEELKPEDFKLSHQGATHNAFHSKCLKTWVLRSPTCPLDRERLDKRYFTDTLTGRIERIMNSHKNVAYAAVLGSAVAGIALLATGGSAAIAAIAGLGAGGVATLSAGGRGGSLALKTAALVVGSLGAASAGVTAAAVGAATSMAATGIAIDWILNRSEVDQIARENIGLGIQLGSLAAVASPWSLPVIPVIALVSGVAAGILSVIR